MLDPRGIGYANSAADLLIWRGPCRLWGAVILTSVTGGDATLYNSQSAEPVRHVLRLEGIADQSTPVLLPVPIFCSEGLYLDVGSDVTEVLVLYEPLLETGEG